MSHIEQEFRQLEIVSLGALRGLFRIAAIGLGFAAAAVVLLLFWSAGALSELLEMLSKHGPA